MMAGSIAIAAATVLPASAQTTQAAKVPARNVMLVHGLFADGSCWSEMVGRLRTKELNVSSVQNPLTTLDDSAEAVRRLLAQIDGPTVLA